MIINSARQRIMVSTQGEQGQAAWVRFPMMEGKQYTQKRFCNITVVLVVV